MKAARLHPSRKHAPASKPEIRSRRPPQTEDDEADLRLIESRRGEASLSHEEAMGRLQAGLNRVVKARRSVLRQLAE